jgi:Alpha galactosidase C-terminal beta sandwich domain
VKLKDRTLLCVFNWSEEATKIPVRLARPGEVTDLWSGQTYGRQTALDVPLKAHEGTVLVVR